MFYLWNYIYHTLPLERVHLLACYDRLLERILSPHSKSHTIPIFGEIMIDPLIHRSVVTQRLPNPSLYPIQKIERHPSCPEHTSEVQIPRPPQRLEQSVAPATNEQVQLQRWWIPWIYWNLRPCSSSRNPLLKVAWQEPNSDHAWQAPAAGQKHSNGQLLAWPQDPCPHSDALGSGRYLWW